MNSILALLSLKALLIEKLSQNITLIISIYDFQKVILYQTLVVIFN